MTVCRTVDEVRAAAAADHDGPATQQQADLFAAIWTSVQTQDPAA